MRGELHHEWRTAHAPALHAHSTVAERGEYLCASDRPLRAESRSSHSSAKCTARSLCKPGDKLRPMPSYADNFCAALAAYMRLYASFDQPTAKPGFLRATL